MTLDAVTLPIRDELRAVETLLDKCIQSKVPIIYDAGKYVLKNGGKRLRPILTILSARLSGVKDESIIKYATLFELIHTASLMHDDVLDNASLRRHNPTAHAKWGNQLSILIGDYLWSRASDLAASHDNHRALCVITRSISLMSEGEIQEVVRSNDPSLSEEDYLEIIEKKTASIIEACCHVGAILGNVSEPLEQALVKYGRLVGTAFQLADDVLDYSANEAKLGKKTGTDLREGKLTLPLILTLTRCESNEGRLIKEALMANTMEEQRIHQITELLHKYKGIEETKRRALDAAAEAKSALEIFKPSIERDALSLLADYACQREE